MGPRREIVGEVEQAARRQGLKFYTSFHHQRLWGWYTSPTATADIYQPVYAGLYWAPDSTGRNARRGVRRRRPTPPPTAPARLTLTMRIPIRRRCPSAEPWRDKLWRDKLWRDKL